MDIILNIVRRRQGLKFSALSFLESAFCRIKRTAVLFSIPLFSLVLVSCGGGSGPADEGENYTTSQNSGNTIAGDSVLSDSTLQMKSATTSVGWCQSANTLLCENFEWSSSLAYQASEQDWQLKGWQFSGSERSGNNCNSAGVDDSQCALKWVQTNDTTLNTLQSARYIFSESGSTYSKIALSWAAKWSANWVWDRVLNPFVSLETTNSDSSPTAFISLGFDQAGFVEVTIAEDKSCGRNKRVIKSDKVLTINNNPGQWHNFQLTVEANDNRYNTADNDTLQLSLNNEVVLSVVDLDLSCTTGVNINTVSYMSNSYNSNVSTEQTVLIDNVLLTM